MEINLKERLVDILEDRKQTPWGLSIGLTKGNINRLFSGDLPKADTLWAIHLVENVNLNWLLTGQGPRFVIDHSDNQLKTADWLAYMSKLYPKYSTWEIVTELEQNKKVIVIAAKSQYNLRSHKCQYMAIKPIVVENDSAKELHDNRVVKVSHETFKDITSGEWGAYRLEHLLNILISKSALSSTQNDDERIKQLHAITTIRSALSSLSHEALTILAEHAQTTLDEIDNFLNGGVISRNTLSKILQSQNMEHLISGQLTMLPSTWSSSYKGIRIDPEKVWDKSEVKPETEIKKAFESIEIS